MTNEEKVENLVLPSSLQSEKDMMQMKDKPSTRGGVFYEIKVEGYLAEDWSDWFGNLKLNHDIEGYTILSGILADQPALHGVLARVRDLGLNLVSLTRVDIK